MIASIISIGDELLIGQTVNTNASFIASELNFAGIPVKSVYTIADNREDILLTLKQASQQAGLIMITGGLGPTKDDITKNALCEYFHSKLVLHQPSLQNIQELFYRRGTKVTGVNRDQALIPHNCKAIKNAMGTAPGMWFQKDKKHFISMPGVPFEMKAMMTDEIIPALIKLHISTPIVHKTLLVTGIGESALAERISEWENNLPSGIKLAYLPEPGIVKLRLSCYDAKDSKTKSIIDTQVKKIKKIIPDLIFGVENDTLQSVTGKLLLKKHATLSTAESCTGGLIAHMITSVSGSSKYYKGSVVAYDNAVKTEILCIDPKLIRKYGAVSEEVVRAMALGVQKLLKTDYALSTSGIAGPDGGTREKPVGTVWIALATPEKVIAEKLMLGNHRERNIRRASLAALNLLRKHLL